MPKLLAMFSALERWGGFLIHPRATLSRLAPGEGRHDWWWLALLFVLGSQIQHLTEAVARFQAFRSVLVLANALALSLLTPLLVGILVESVIGTRRNHLRNLPLVALVVAATEGNVLRQQGVMLPGPHYLPEIVGTIWAAGLAIWIRKTVPAPEVSNG